MKQRLQIGTELHLESETVEEHQYETTQQQTTTTEVETTMQAELIQQQQQKQSEAVDNMQMSQIQIATEGIIESQQQRETSAADVDVEINKGEEENNETTVNRANRGSITDRMFFECLEEDEIETEIEVEETPKIEVTQLQKETIEIEKQISEAEVAELQESPKFFKRRRRNAICSVDDETDGEMTMKVATEERELEREKQQIQLQNRGVMSGIHKEAVDKNRKQLTIADLRSFINKERQSINEATQSRSQQPEREPQMLHCPTEGCGRSFPSKQSLKGHTNVCGKQQSEGMLECPNVHCKNRLADPGKRYKGSKGLNIHLKICNKNQK